MEMNAYDMNRVLFVAQECGVRRAGLQFTDHAGYLGVVLFLRRGSWPRAPPRWPQGALFAYS